MLSIKETEYIVEYDPKTMTWKEKVLWCGRLWFGYKNTLKMKVYRDPEVRI